MFEFYGIIFIEVRKMRKKGFSLIELMIVLVIIGILISLIFPAAKKARDGALQRQCANNLNQIGTAFILYAKDHNGKFPDPVNGINDSNAYLYAATLVTEGYLPDDDKIFDCPGSPHIGTKDEPDYRYGNTKDNYNKDGTSAGENPDYPYTVYTPPDRTLCGCNNLGGPDYEQPHTGGLNYVNIAGRVYWEEGS